MKSRTFVQLLEAAHERVYGEQGNIRSVPYDPAPGDMSVPVTDCIGLLLTQDAHMASIVAEAMYLIWEDRDGLWNEDEDKDEALGDFRDLVGTMRVAPFMSWTCIYFPGITEDDVETGREDPIMMMLPESFQYLSWNTGRQYSAAGQRIGAVLRQDGNIVFHDIDRGIWGLVEDANFDKDSIMEVYDRGAYVNPLSSSDADVIRAKQLAEQL